MGLQEPTSHMGKLFSSALDIVPVFGLDSILDGAGDRVVDAEDGALNQFDFPRCVSSQLIRRSLSFPPRLGRARLTPSVR
jgi:hypothetical protein